MRLSELHALVEAQAPIIGINSNGEIWFKPEATEQQRALARALIELKLPEIEL